MKKQNAKPFFMQFLEAQHREEEVELSLEEKQRLTGKGTLKYPSDRDESNQTQKYPSDADEAN
mgnify:CR=1 FL=1